MEEEERPNYIPWILFAMFFGVVIVVCSLLNYKNETLICTKTDDLCKVERVNLFNMPSTKRIAKYSEVEGVSYYRQRIKGNRYGKGYREYIMVFDLKGGKQENVFSKTYYEKEELDDAIRAVRSLFKSNADEIKYERN